MKVWPQALALTLLTLACGAVPAAAERTAQGAAVGLGTGLPPLPGQYDARLCVSVAAGPGNCGPVVVDMGEGGQAVVQINDVVYRLQRVADQLGVSLFHGTVQLDGFIVSHKWSGNTLTFSDPEKGTRYELQIGTRRIVAQ